MTKDDDPIDVLVRVWCQQHPEVSFAEAYRVEHHLRQVFGGARIYVRRVETAEKKSGMLGAALAGGASVHEARAAAGMSLRTAYRCLAQPWKVRYWPR